MNKSLVLSAIGICAASFVFAQNAERVDTTLIAKIKMKGLNARR